MIDCEGVHAYPFLVPKVWVAFALKEGCCVEGGDSSFSTVAFKRGSLAPVAMQATGEWAARKRGCNFVHDPRVLVRSGGHDCLHCTGRISQEFGLVKPPPDFGLFRLTKAKRRGILNSF